MVTAIAPMAMPGAVAEASELPERLPPLREDLQLMPGASHRDGSPSWMIHDPVCNRFYQIGWLEFSLLSHWSLGTPEAVIQAVRDESVLSVSEDEISALLMFLARQQLLRSSDAQSSDRLASIRRARKATGWKWLLHNYLFIRVPLLRPGRFLQATMPLVRPLFSRTFVMLVLGATLLGLVLASRQWDTFVTTFQDKLTLEGLLGYLIALAFVKSLHELGHAYTATRYGVRVAHMGFALLVMWPVLYTDTSESWKLTDRRQRFHIVGAGILVELMVAGVSTLAWSLTEDPVAKSAFFFLATASWVLSLTLNASPFMRFDGYYLLCDALDIPNLHERAAGLARAQMRRSLLGWDEPNPEHFEPRLRTFLVAFSWLTWVYRFFVFLGIAAAVYFFFFKLLGIGLFMVEVSWFVVMPVWKELRVWGQRGGIHWPRVTVWITLILLVAAPLIFLGRHHVRAPAWIHSSTQYVLYSPMPAQVMEAPARLGPVRSGQVLYVLQAPELIDKAARADQAAHTLQEQLAGLQGIKDGEEQRGVLTDQLSREWAEKASQEAEIRRLTIRAPIDGSLYDLDPEIRPGVWISPKDPLGISVDPRAWVVEAFIPQQDLDAIEPGDAAKFYARGDAKPALSGHVVRIDTERTVTLPHAMLDTEHGGQIPAATSRSGQMVPRDALYRVQIKLDQPPATARARPGNVVIESHHSDLVPQWIKDMIVVVIRESGF
jgi:putative peptide zinc metalloprotease protein